MNPSVTTVKSKVTDIAASAALGMGSLMAGAQSAVAVPGDLMTYVVGNGAKPVDIITGPDGTMWAANEGANSISRVTANGQITSSSVPCCRIERTGTGDGGLHRR
jgi:streptogramin lyase